MAQTEQKSVPSYPLDPTLEDSKLGLVRSKTDSDREVVDPALDVPRGYEPVIGGAMNLFVALGPLTVIT